MNKGLNSQEDH